MWSTGMLELGTSGIAHYNEVQPSGHCLFPWEGSHSGTYGLFPDASDFARNMTQLLVA
jgi:hypothetical protein